MPTSDRKARKTRAAMAAETAVAEQAAATGNAAEAAPFSLGLQPPAALQSLAEDGMRRAREGYDRMRSAAEEASDMLEENVAATRATLHDLQALAITMAKSHTNAGFDLAAKLVATTSVIDAVHLQSEFLRGRIEAIANDSRQFQGALAKAAAGFPAALKATMERTLPGAKTTT